MKTVKTWVNKLLPDSYKSSLGDSIQNGIDEIRKEAYNQALDDCIEVCQSFRDYDESRDCIGIIRGIENLKK